MIEKITLRFEQVCKNFSMIFSASEFSWDDIGLEHMELK